MLPLHHPASAARPLTDSNGHPAVSKTEVLPYTKGAKWRSRLDLHQQPPPSHGGARLLAPQEQKTSGDARGEIPLARAPHKNYPERVSHPHCLRSRRSASSLGYPGQKMVALRPVAGLSRSFARRAKLRLRPPTKSGPKSAPSGRLDRPWPRQRPRLDGRFRFARQHSAFDDQSGAPAQDEVRSDNAGQGQREENQDCVMGIHGSWGLE